MSKKSVLVSAGMFACLLVTSPAAQAQSLQIQNGFDLFQTLEGFHSEQAFIDCPIPGTTFEDASDPPLTDCEAFAGTVLLKGVPLRTFDGVTVGAVDTIVERKTAATFEEPEDDVTVSVSVELVRLNLISVEPIEVACDEGVTHWQVEVQIDEETGPSTGEMEVTLEYPDLIGGRVESELNVCPRVTFTRVDAGGSFEMMPCDLDCGPELLGATTWAFDLSDPDSVLKIGDLTTVNFNFTQPPPSEDDRCPSIYPHQEATAAHLGCQPDPCARDIEPPMLILPPVTPCECAAPGGSPVTNECIAGWLQEVRCPDELSSATCGPKSPDPPSFFLSACEPGHPTEVAFYAEDKCGNRIEDTAVMTVKDTAGPDVTAREQDLYCLWPANRRYFCFNQDDDFQEEGIAPEISDTCGAVDSWVFTDCASDQPETSRGDRTTDDCIVTDGGHGFCVRSERATSREVDPDRQGRRYAVAVRGTDDCGNVGAAEVIGSIHVPFNDPSDACLSPDVRDPPPSDPPPPVPPPDEDHPPDCNVEAINLTAPPNGKFFDVPIAVEDPDGDPVAVVIHTIFQDEPVGTATRGEECPDAEGIGTGTARVRAERDGSGDGRVYHVLFTATDSDGNSCNGEATICVPHDSGGTVCTDQGGCYASTSCNSPDVCP